MGTLSRLRSYVKRRVPAAGKAVLEPIRRFVVGPGIEESVLRPYVFEAEWSEAPRISLVIPGISAKTAFGGVSTGVRLFEHLADELGVDRRIVVEHPYSPDDSIANDSVPVHDLARSDWRLPTRRREIFIAFNWWTALNIRSVLSAQSLQFEQDVLPRVYLLQEYEPQLYPFSSAHELARSALDSGELPLWVIFNSLELESYYRLQGHRADRSFAFAPRMSRSLARAVPALSRDRKTKTVIVYGRPHVARNCFSIAVMALQRWATDNPGRADWRFVSAGQPHRDIDLGGGHVLHSVGKLTLDEYADLLSTSSVGLSLMSSPHPSYPPLEMAHFGVRTITNDYCSKSMTDWHPNLVVAPSLDPVHLASTLATVIASEDQTLGRGVDQLSASNDYLEGEEFSCSEELVAALGPLLGLSG